MGWGALAKRFGVPESVLRRALAEAGETKVPGRPGRKPRAVEAATSSPAGLPAPYVDPLLAFRDQIGKVADAVVAEKAGVTRWQVARWRVRHGIPAYDGFRFATRGGDAGAGGAASGPRKRRKAAPKASATPKREVAAPAAAAAPAAPVAAPIDAPAANPARASAWLVVTGADARSARFVVVAPDLAAAAARAVSVASTQPDGPWAVQAVQWVGELAP